MVSTRGGSLPPLTKREVVPQVASRRPLGVVSCASSPSSTPSLGRKSIPAWKVALDWTLILITSPVWFPLMLAIGLWIKSTGGPVLFKQTRIGRDGLPFTILKFRSMKAGAETKAHEIYFKSLVENAVPMTKLDFVHDSRIIPGGRWLRASGLDELPQLFNVLRGEMSLVGPRPCTTRELELYSEGQMERFNCRPGLTGLWQVSGKNETTFDRMVELDIQYYRELSPRKDLSIIIKTIPTILKLALANRRKVESRHEAHAQLQTDSVRIQ